MAHRVDLLPNENQSLKASRVCQGSWGEGHGDETQVQMSVTQHIRTAMKNNPPSEPPSIATPAVTAVAVARRRRLLCVPQLSFGLRPATRDVCKPARGIAGWCASRLTELVSGLSMARNSGWHRDSLCPTDSLFRSQSSNASNIY